MDKKRTKNRWILSIERYTESIYNELCKLNQDEASIIADQFKLIFYDTFTTYYFSTTFQTHGSKSFAHSYVHNLALIMESARAIEQLEYIWEHFTNFMINLESDLCVYERYEAAHNIKTIHDFFKMYFYMNDDDEELDIYLDD